MKLIPFISIAAVCAAGALAPIAVRAQDDSMEVLTRGPLHEAFAEAVNFDPKPGIIVEEEPPEPIDELPPEQQPVGDNVAWIPGYWAWDEEESEFLWVSGIWRNLPPDREWVPGYWHETGARYQWISGYWSEAEITEVAYLPEPPQPVEAGPNVTAPSDDHSWIPGSWIWVDTRYRWRPGYWQPLRDDWTYVPDHYHWTPRGYVYVGGYWDYAAVRRGVVFAPVRFHGTAYRQASFSYTPSIVISVAAVVDHLFVRPSYGHYYFGDYYEPRYRDRGFFPSYSYHRVGIRGYDPIYAHLRWRHRGDRGWERRHSEEFDYFRANRDARPPRTWSGLRELADGRRGGRARDRDYVMASSLARLATRENADEGGRQFRKLDGEARERVVSRRGNMREFVQQRRQLEARGGADREARGENRRQRTDVAKRVRSPIFGRKAAQFAKGEAPPARGERPQPVDPGREATDRPPPRGSERNRRGGDKPPDETGDEAADTTPVPPGRDRETRPERTRPDQREARPQRPERGRQSGEKDTDMAPQRERKAQPEREPKAQPEREPKAQPERERKAQPQRERKAQPQRERKAQPQRERKKEE